MVHIALLLLLVPPAELTTAADRRKADFNVLLAKLHAVASQHQDVLQYYAYHPENMREDGVGVVAQPLVPSLQMLTGEGLDSHLLELDGENGEDGAVVVSTASDDASCPVISSSPTAPPRCSSEIPLHTHGRNSSLPYTEFVIVLASAPSHFEYRRTMRETFLSSTALGAWDVKRVFAVGAVRDPAVQQQLLEEQSAHGDILRTPSYDGYRNLSLKVFEAYEMVLATQRFRWIVRCDDNNIVRMDRVLEQLSVVRKRHELRVWGNIHKDAIGEPPAAILWHETNNTLGIGLVAWSLPSAHRGCLGWLMCWLTASVAVHKDRIYRNYELDFSAPAYPLFPTGCLHAITYEVAWWLACMRPELRRFKSADDTTLGAKPNQFHLYFTLCCFLYSFSLPLCDSFIAKNAPLTVIDCTRVSIDNR